MPRTESGSSSKQNTQELAQRQLIWQQKREQLAQKLEKRSKELEQQMEGNERVKMLLSNSHQTDEPLSSKALRLAGEEEILEEQCYNWDNKKLTEW